MSIKYESNLKGVLSALDKSRIKGLTESCLMVQAQAKMFTPVKTGQLRDSISYEVDEKTGKVGTPLEHGLYVEFGTGEFAEKGDGRRGGWTYQDEKGNWVFTTGQRPKPFLKPAFRENKSNIIELLGEAVRIGVGE